MTRPGDLLAEHRLMYEAVSARQAEVCSDLAPVLERLMGGQTRIPLEVPWHQDRHLIVLLRVDAEDGRIYFFNPSSTQEPPGTLLADPERRAEGASQESVELTTLARWFGDGLAFALI